MQVSPTPLATSVDIRMATSPWTGSSEDVLEEQSSLPDPGAQQETVMFG